LSHFIRFLTASSSRKRILIAMNVSPLHTWGLFQDWPGRERSPHWRQNGRLPSRLPRGLAGGRPRPGGAGCAREPALRRPACPFCAGVRLKGVQNTSWEQRLLHTKGAGRAAGGPGVWGGRSLCGFVGFWCRRVSPGTGFGQCFTSPRRTCP